MFAKKSRSIDISAYDQNRFKNFGCLKSGSNYENTEYNNGPTDTNNSDKMINKKDFIESNKQSIKTIDIH